MSVIVHPIAHLKRLRIEINASIYPSSRSAAIITCRVLLAPKNTYLKWVERAFNFKIGGSSMDGFAVESLDSSDLTLARVDAYNNLVLEVHS